MDLPDQSEAERQGPEPVEAVVHRPDVVDDLDDVAGQLGRPLVELVREHVVEGALRALDLRAEYGFAADVHRDEEFRVGQGARRAVKAADLLGGLREAVQEARRDLERRGGGSGAGMNAE